MTYPYFGEMPPEFEEKYKTAVASTEMEIADFNHGVLGFIDGLDKDELQILTKLLALAVRGGIGYWVGYIDSILAFKYDRCAGCRVDHSPLEED